MKLTHAIVWAFPKAMSTPGGYIELVYNGKLEAPHAVVGITGECGVWGLMSDERLIATSRALSDAGVDVIFLDEGERVELQ